MPRKGPELPQVDVNRIYTKPHQELEPHEARWLREHGELLDEGVETDMVFFYLPDGSKVSNDPSFFGGIDALVEARAKELAAQMVRNVPQGPNRGTAIPDVPRSGSPINPPPDNTEADRNYDTWKRDDLLAELHDRGLDIDGNKGDFIGRLRDDDAAKGLAPVETFKE